MSNWRSESPSPIPASPTSASCASTNNAASSVENSKGSGPLDARPIAARKLARGCPWSGILAAPGQMPTGRAVEPLVTQTPCQLWRARPRIPTTGEDAKTSPERPKSTWTSGNGWYHRPFIQSHAPGTWARDMGLGQELAEGLCPAGDRWARPLSFTDEVSIG